MLSYLHGYHAGNHADVLKHTVLTALLARLVTKDKALRYIESHAGAGGYDLRAAAAQRNREHEGLGWTARHAGCSAPLRRRLPMFPIGDDREAGGPAAIVMIGLVILNVLAFLLKASKYNAGSTALEGKMDALLPIQIDAPQ